MFYVINSLSKMQTAYYFKMEGVGGGVGDCKFLGFSCQADNYSSLFMSTYFRVPTT